jgi:adenosylcobinamide-GDP ribazoletransferase
VVTDENNSASSDIPPEPTAAAGATGPTGSAAGSATGATRGGHAFRRAWTHSWAHGFGAAVWLAGWGRDLHLVLSFFTRLPVGWLQPGSASDGTPLQYRLAQAARAFPLAGLVVGLTGGLVYWIVLQITHSPLLAALLAVAATCGLTGALHEDGLSDVADGLGARGDTARKLAAMKDSHAGSFGVLALVFATLIKATAIASLGVPHRVIPALVVTHVLARSVLPLAMRSLPLVNGRGLAAMAGRPSPAGVYSALGIGLFISFCAVFLPACLVALVVALVATALVGAIARRQFGGYTGDVLGAIEQVAEVAILVNLVSLT